MSRTFGLYDEGFLIYLLAQMFVFFRVFIFGLS